MRSLQFYSSGNFYNSSLIGYVEVHEKQLKILWISGTKTCGLFCVSATATAATERLSEALRVNNVEVLFVEDKVELGVTPVCS